jgi:hypothetical protein
MNPESKLLLNEMHKLFAKADRKWDARFADMDRKWDNRLVDSEQRIEQRFVEFDDTITKRLSIADKSMAQLKVPSLVLAN